MNGTHRTKLVSMAAAVGAALCLAQGTYGAVSIGLNFAGDVGGQLASSTSAGVTAVAQSSWNNLPAANSSNLPLLDSTGQATSVTATYNSNYNSGYFAGNPQGFSAGSGNALLNAQEIYGNPSVTISGIPYSQYDVYVYIDSDQKDRGQAQSLTALAGGTVNSTTYYQTPVGITGGSSISGTFVQGTNTDSTATNFSNSAYPLANYVLFQGNSATSIKLDVATFGASGLAAIQIVEAIPEPASLSLLAAGSLLLLGRRRRSAGRA